MKAQHKHQEKDLQSAEGVEEKPVLLLLGSTPKQIRDFSAYLSFLSPQIKIPNLEPGLQTQDFPTPSCFNPFPSFSCLTGCIPLDLTSQHDKCLTPDISESQCWTWGSAVAPADPVVGMTRRLGLQHTQHSTALHIDTGTFSPERPPGSGSEWSGQNDFENFHYQKVLMGWQCIIYKL